MSERAIALLEALVDAADKGADDLDHPDVRKAIGDARVFLRRPRRDKPENPHGDDDDDGK